MIGSSFRWLRAGFFALSLPALTATGALAACDSIPDLHVVDADGGAEDAPPTMASDASVGPADVNGVPVPEAAPEEASEHDAGHPTTCDTVSCPSCPPEGGSCCPSGIPCVGYGCLFACTQCDMCKTGQMCCVKTGPGMPMTMCKALTDKCS